MIFCFCFRSLCNLIFWSVVTLLPLVYYTYNTLTSGSTYEITVFAGLFLFGKFLTVIICASGVNATRQLVFY